MNDVFEERLKKFAFVSFDDILISSLDATLIQKYLRMAFPILKENQLHVDVKEKFIFEKPKLVYLGHIISIEGKDEKLFSVREQILMGQVAVERYNLQKGCLLYEDWLVLLIGSSCMQLLMRVSLFACGMSIGLYVYL